MAGLILKELKHRNLVKRILIVVPGHLKDQMEERITNILFKKNWECIIVVKAQSKTGRDILRYQ